MYDIEKFAKTIGKIGKFAEVAHVAFSLYFLSCFLNSNCLPLQKTLSYLLQAYVF